jgi:hypothetical protein
VAFDYPISPGSKNGIDRVVGALNIGGRGPLFVLTIYLEILTPQPSRDVSLKLKEILEVFFPGSHFEGVITFVVTGVTEFGRKTYCT